MVFGGRASNCFSSSSSFRVCSFIHLSRSVNEKGTIDAAAELSHGLEGLVKGIGSACKNWGFFECWWKKWKNNHNVLALELYEAVDDEAMTLLHLKQRFMEMEESGRTNGSESNTWHGDMKNKIFVICVVILCNYPFLYSVCKFCL